VGTELVRDQDKIMLVLAYFGCLSLIPYLTVKDSEFVTWHARQGLVLLGAEVLIGVGLSLGLTVIGIGACLGPILNLGFLGLSIMGVVKALRGERWRIPVLADLADKF
jgi:uncharacterized membrane protein